MLGSWLNEAHSSDRSRHTCAHRDLEVYLYWPRHFQVIPSSMFLRGIINLHKIRSYAHDAAIEFIQFQPRQGKSIVFKLLFFIAVRYRVRLPDRVLICLLSIVHGMA